MEMFCQKTIAAHLHAQGLVSIRLARHFPKQKRNSKRSELPLLFRLLPKIKDKYNPATWMLEVSLVAAEVRLSMEFGDYYKTSDLYNLKTTHIRVYLRDIRTCLRTHLQFIFEQGLEAKILYYPRDYQAEGTSGHYVRIPLQVIM
ncbi:hypothetical protein D1007_24271 [Hordeum vulgare]|nr:hypothetical protein D1007_24271 [Hordeum vulgare]